ncbi:hypothetical protein [Streptomyces sp. AC512_CC834]|uniref:hypothetical protein n=1 Tax=Streptomyces sp. AC512_CC834 TaxID=2823691 RepID=UPI001C25749D|nr:hypothetical protein [Streptomyces sp. AC512_CC834]
MNIIKPAALLFAATALAAGSTITATAADGPDGTRVTGLQQKAEQVLADSPKPLRVSADAVQYEGLTVTDAPVTKGAQDLACRYGHLCMVVDGTKFDFYKCQMWKLSNWTGDGPFTNNQTSGTVAKFYNQDRSVRWTSTAYEAGRADWDPVWYLRPC